MRLVFAVAALALAGCDGSDSSPPIQPAEKSKVVEPVAPQPPNPTASVLMPTGPADIRVGMTIAQVERLGHAVTIVQPPEPEATCGFATVDGFDGLLVMLDGDRLVRFDVDEPAAEGGARAPSWKSPEGAGVGTTEADLRRIYGNRLFFEPHPYTSPEGRYAIVHAEGEVFGIIFETHESRAQSWRSGAWAQVQWIEGYS